MELAAIDDFYVFAEDNHRSSSESFRAVDWESRQSLRASDWHTAVAHWSNAVALADHHAKLRGWRVLRRLARIKASIYSGFQRRGLLIRGFRRFVRRVECQKTHRYRSVLLKRWAMACWRSYLRAVYANGSANNDHHHNHQGSMELISSGLQVYVCFKWLSLVFQHVQPVYPPCPSPMSTSHSTSLFDSNNYIRRFRGYAQGHVALPAASTPMFVHATALLDAFQLKRMFQAWRLRTSIILVFAHKCLVRQARLAAQRWSAYTRRRLRLRLLSTHVAVRRRHRWLASVSRAWRVSFLLFAHVRQRWIPATARRMLDKLQVFRWSRLCGNLRHRLAVRHRMRRTLKGWIVATSAQVNSRVSIHTKAVSFAVTRLIQQSLLQWRHRREHLRCDCAGFALRRALAVFLALYWRRWAMRRWRREAIRRAHATRCSTAVVTRVSHRMRYHCWQQWHSCMHRSRHLNRCANRLVGSSFARLKYAVFTQWRNQFLLSVNRRHDARVAREIQRGFARLFCDAVTHATSRAVKLWAMRRWRYMAAVSTIAVCVQRCWRGHRVRCIMIRGHRDSDSYSKKSKKVSKDSYNDYLSTAIFLVERLVRSGLVGQAYRCDRRRCLRTAWASWRGELARSRSEAQVEAGMYQARRLLVSRWARRALSGWARSLRVRLRYRNNPIGNDISANEHFIHGNRHKHEYSGLRGAWPPASPASAIAASSVHSTPRTSPAYLKSGVTMFSPSPARNVKEYSLNYNLNLNRNHNHDRLGGGGIRLGDYRRYDTNTDSNSTFDIGFGSDVSAVELICLRLRRALLVRWHFRLVYLPRLCHLADRSRRMRLLHGVIHTALTRQRARSLLHKLLCRRGDRHYLKPHVAGFIRQVALWRRDTVGEALRRRRLRRSFLTVWHTRVSQLRQLCRRGKSRRSKLLFAQFLRSMRFRRIDRSKRFALARGVDRQWAELRKKEALVKLLRHAMRRVRLRRLSSQHVTHREFARTPLRHRALLFEQLKRQQDQAAQELDRSHVSSVSVQTLAAQSAPYHVHPGTRVAQHPVTGQLYQVRYTTGSMPNTSALCRMRVKTPQEALALRWATQLWVAWVRKRGKTRRRMSRWDQQSIRASLKACLARLSKRVFSVRKRAWITRSYLTKQRRLELQSAVLQWRQRAYLASLRCLGTVLLVRRLRVAYLACFRLLRRCAVTRRCHRRTSQTNIARVAGFLALRCVMQWRWVAAVRGSQRSLARRARRLGWQWRLRYALINVWHRRTVYRRRLTCVARRLTLRPCVALWLSATVTQVFYRRHVLSMRARVQQRWLRDVIGHWRIRAVYQSGLKAATAVMRRVCRKREIAHAYLCWRLVYRAQVDCCKTDLIVLRAKRSTKSLYFHHWRHAKLVRDLRQAQLLRTVFDAWAGYAVTQRSKRSGVTRGNAVWRVKGLRRGLIAVYDRYFQVRLARYKGNIGGALWRKVVLAAVVASWVGRSRYRKTHLARYRRLLEDYAHTQFNKYRHRCDLEADRNGDTSHARRTTLGRFERTRITMSPSNNNWKDRSLNSPNSSIGMATNRGFNSDGYSGSDSPIHGGGRLSPGDLNIAVNLDADVGRSRSRSHSPTHRHSRANRNDRNKDTMYESSMPLAMAEFDHRYGRQYIAANSNQRHRQYAARAAKELAAALRGRDIHAKLFKAFRVLRWQSLRATRSRRQSLQSVLFHGWRSYAFRIKHSRLAFCHRLSLLLDTHLIATVLSTWRDIVAEGKLVRCLAHFHHMTHTCRVFTSWRRLLTQRRLARKTLDQMFEHCLGRTMRHVWLHWQIVVGPARLIGKTELAKRAFYRWLLAFKSVRAHRKNQSRRMKASFQAWKKFVRKFASAAKSMRHDRELIVKTLMRIQRMTAKSLLRGFSIWKLYTAYATSCDNDGNDDYDRDSVSMLSGPHHHAYSNSVYARAARLAQGSSIDGRIAVELESWRDQVRQIRESSEESRRRLRKERLARVAADNFNASNIMSDVVE